MTTLKEYKEREESYLYEFKKIKKHGIDVKVQVRQDAYGQSYIVMWLMHNDKFITCTENIVELESIRLVLDELKK